MLSEVDDTVKRAVVTLLFWRERERESLLSWRHLLFRIRFSYHSKFLIMSLLWECSICSTIIITERERETKSWLRWREKESWDESLVLFLSHVLVLILVLLLSPSASQSVMMTLGFTLLLCISAYSFSEASSSWALPLRWCILHKFSCSVCLETKIHRWKVRLPSCRQYHYFRSQLWHFKHDVWKREQWYFVWIRDMSKRMVSCFSDTSVSSVQYHLGRHSASSVLSESSLSLEYSILWLPDAFGVSPDTSRVANNTSSCWIIWIILLSVCMMNWREKRDKLQHSYLRQGSVFLRMSSLSQRHQSRERHLQTVIPLLIVIPFLAILSVKITVNCRVYVLLGLCREDDDLRQFLLLQVPLQLYLDDCYPFPSLCSCFLSLNLHILSRSPNQRDEGSGTDVPFNGLSRSTYRREIVV